MDDKKREKNPNSSHWSIQPWTIFPFFKASREVFSKTKEILFYSHPRSNKTYYLIHVFKRVSQMLEVLNTTISKIPEVLSKRIQVGIQPISLLLDPYQEPSNNTQKMIRLVKLSTTHQTTRICPISEVKEENLFHLKKL